MTKRRIIIGSCLFISILILGFCVYSTLFSNDNNDRSSFNTESISGTDDFTMEYDQALGTPGSWIEDAELVARRYAGGKFQNQRVTSLPKESTNTVFIIETIAHDDSVGAIKYRIELTKNESIWQVKWVGEVHKCALGRGDIFNWGWQTKPCT